MYNQRNGMLEHSLLQFSLRLVPVDTDLEDAKSVANKIFRTLQKNVKYRIDRVGIMGSVEKKTALAHEFDLDCVIFINDITIRDFPKVFDVFEQTLELEESMSAIVFKAPKTKGSALQATIDGFEFDIVPAVNFSQDGALQRRKVLHEISKLERPSKDGYRWSSSLIQDQVKFIKQQSPFAHDVIRLAKFWNRSIYIGDYVSGRSTMIELIAVKAAHQEENNNKSIVRAIGLFLNMMSNLKVVTVIFNTFYSQSEVNHYVLGQRPLVLDPSNPHNNFAYDLCKKEIVRKTFEQFAKVSLQRLNSVYALFNLFEMQPAFPSLSNWRGKDWLVGVYDNTYGSKRIRVIERNARGNHEAVKIFKHYVCYNIRFLNNEAKSKEELKTEVKKEIDRMQNDTREWSPSTDRHSDRDVTFEIPSGSYVVSCSVNV